MLNRHLVLYFFYNVALNVCGLMCKEILTPAAGQKLLESVVKLTDALVEVTPYINASLYQIPSNCIQMQCKFVCFNGRSSEIEQDILIVSKRNNYNCSNIEELRLYDYEFPENKISYGFLGNYIDKVDTLYLASSQVKDIASGAFANGNFKAIILEDLQLKQLKKDFFKGITHKFSTLTVIQKGKPIQTVHTDFLFYVKYQIKYLNMQAGLKSVCNLTGGDILLNNLIHVDFSYNDLGSGIQHTAFSKLSMIEYMYLSHTNLQYLPAYLFSNFATTLTYLDLSYNKLKTISRSIFGWKGIRHDLRIYAQGNEWSCVCDLQYEMKSIFSHYNTSLLCFEPEGYKGLSIFDAKICGENSIDFSKPSVINGTQTPELETSTTSANSDDNLTEIIQKSLMELNCLASRQYISHPMECPQILFDVVPKEKSQVNVVIGSSEKSYDYFGLIWFTKATTRYNQMEINYNEYGLGCYNVISYVTQVKDLVPDKAYTFCLVVKEQLNVSPFNCKSVYISDSLAVKYNDAWLTRDMTRTVVLFVVVGIIVFIFLGILITYALLKLKPILVKGSQQSTALESNNFNLVVLPKNKSIGPTKEKEKRLSCLFKYFRKRRKSIDSEVSYESYINPNLYEVIPSAEEQNKNCTTLVSRNPDTENCYLAPLESEYVTPNFVQFCSKRNSNDALPEIPVDEPPLSLIISEMKHKTEYAHIENIFLLDSQV